MSTFDRAVQRLERYAHTRNRDVDRETRTVTISDDEALALLEVLSADAAPKPVPTMADLEPHKALRVRVVIETTMRDRYVHAVSATDTVAERVDRCIRETIINGLTTRYLDGSGDTVWSDHVWEWSPISQPSSE